MGLKRGISLTYSHMNNPLISMLTIMEHSGNLSEQEEVVLSLYYLSFTVRLSQGRGEYPDHVQRSKDILKFSVGWN